MSVVQEVAPPSVETLGTDAFAADVLRGLSQTPKTLPCRYFYDEKGSRLFEQITTLDEYYLTRCEVEILQGCAAHLVSILGGKPFRLVELGAGDAKKTVTLLWYFLARRLEFDYVPSDICRHSVRRLVHSLRCKRGKEFASSDPTNTASRTWRTSPPREVSSSRITSSTGGAILSILCGESLSRPTRNCHQLGRQLYCRPPRENRDGSTTAIPT
jgi:hypothetical protein